MQQVVLILFKKQYHLTQRWSFITKCCNMMASELTDLRTWSELLNVPKTPM